ncbi:MAG: hypothetical protein MRQ09_04445 [Candidatus Midichloria sp.]|nr:hypothetical protein [Candidatus Midichloria sp.]
MDNDKAGSLREALDKVVRHDGKSMIKKYDTHGWPQGGYSQWFLHPTLGGNCKKQ